MEAEQTILLLLIALITSKPNVFFVYTVPLPQAYKGVRQKGKRDMKDYSIGLMMVVLPIAAFFYVVFNGYPSLFASVIIGAVMGICLLKKAVAK